MFGDIAPNGTPQKAVLGSMVVGFMTVIANYLMPKEVFDILLATSGTIALLVYLVIAISQLRMRQRMEANGETPAFRMWMFPTLTWIVIVFICAVVVLMAIRPEHQVEVISTGLLSLALLVVGWVRSRMYGTPWMGSREAKVATQS